MSDTCRLFLPFGDPWPSCLLPSHSVTGCRFVLPTAVCVQPYLRPVVTTGSPVKGVPCCPPRAQPGAPFLLLRPSGWWDPEPPAPHLGVALTHRTPWGPGLSRASFPLHF